MVVHTTRPWLRRFDLTYTPPSSAPVRLLWRLRMRFETAFAISMLEPWEKFLVLLLLHLFTYIFVVGTLKYLPHHLEFVRQRAVFYFEGIGSDEL